MISHEQNDFKEAYYVNAFKRNFNFPKDQEVIAPVVTWDPLNTHADITLSGGNLIADHDGASVGRIQSFATLGRSTGKYYFEVLVNVDSVPTIGIGEVTATLEGRIGDEATDWGWQNNGRFYNNGSYSTSGGGYIDLDIVQVAVDLDNGHIWWGKNDTWYGSGSPNPATGTDPAFTNLSGTLYPGICMYGTSEQETGRFKLSDFDYTPPSGFSPWED